MTEALRAWPLHPLRFRHLIAIGPLTIRGMARTYSSEQRDPQERLRFTAGPLLSLLLYDCHQWVLSVHSSALHRPQNPPSCLVRLRGRRMKECPAG